jgi:hypothetical protein
MNSNDVTGIDGGTGLYVTTNSYGFGDGPVRVQARFNTITGADDGVVVEETGGKTSTVAFTRSSLAGNDFGMRNLGTTNVNATCNWWGLATGPLLGVHFSGSVTRSPYLIVDDINSSCAVKIYPGGVAPKAHPEGDSGTTQVEVVVRLDRRSSAPISVQWYTADGTATAADNDYTPASGTLTWAPGTIFQYIYVEVEGDVTVEPDQEFTINLHSPTNAQIGFTPRVIRIVNDD